MSDWVLVANRVSGRVFDRRTMTLLFEMKNSLGREKNRAFTTDRPSLGRNRMATRSSTHNMANRKHPHDDAAVTFARKMGHQLNRRESQFDHLLVVAEPRMLGWIRAKLSDVVKDKSEWLKKDLGKSSIQMLKKTLKP